MTNRKTDSGSESRREISSPNQIAKISYRELITDALTKSRLISVEDVVEEISLQIEHTIRSSYLHQVKDFQKQLNQTSSHPNLFRKF